MKKSQLKMVFRVVNIFLFLTVPIVMIAQPPQRNAPLKQLFTRGQTAEYEILKALKFNPTGSITRFSSGETPKKFAELTPLEQAFGSLALVAAELYASRFDQTVDGPTMMNKIGSPNMPYYKPKVIGILGLLVTNAAAVPETKSQQAYELKKWVLAVYKSMKIRAAKEILAEYQKWNLDPCEYKAEGYTRPADCVLKDKNVADWLTKPSPPENIICKSGLKSLFSSNANHIANITAMGLASLTTAVASVLVASAVGVATSVTVPLIGGGVAIVPTSLFSAFGGTIAGVSSTELAAIGTVGWAGVIAAPVAATILAIVVGTTEGFRVVEATKLEPMLKLKVGAAMTDPINLVNALSDEHGASLFFLGFQEASLNGFKVSDAKADGELRFYCQAGYVSRFNVTYTINTDKTGIAPKYKTVDETTRDLAVSNEQYIAIPWNATNIKVKGWYLAGDWKELVDKSIPTPTYMCFTAYGTIFDAKYKHDCPEVGNMTTKRGELKVTHGGGYVAWMTVRYFQNGKEVTVLNRNDLTAGWSQKFDIPVDAKNITLSIQNTVNGGVVFNQTWPERPNVCIKIYGPVWEPKWNNECQ